MMTPEEHAAQQTRMEKKIDALVVQATRIETYQKTHYGKLKEHDEELGKMKDRISKNEKVLAGASSIFTVGYMFLAAWISDVFKRGGS